MTRRSLLRGRFRLIPGRQDGFSIAEALVAGLIMVIAMVPIVGMFDGAISTVGNLSDIHASVAVAQNMTERIKGMPFYEPYTNTDKDVDDHFWGTRDPVNSNPQTSTGPNWAAIPEVQYYGYGAIADYAGYRVGVQLCYLDDDTGPSTMGQYWGPKKKGNDLPWNSSDVEIHLLVVRVNVHWMIDGYENGIYSLDTILSPNEATYTFGVKRIQVDGPDSVLGTKLHAAAHWPDVSVQVTIDGWGFNTSSVAASLVRDQNNDIPITLTTKTSTRLIGTVNLGHTGSPGTSHPWYPKADVGAWSVKIKQEDILSTYLYQGFVVEYPRPVISDFFNLADSSKAASDVGGPFTIHAEGGYFISKAELPRARLVQVVEVGDPDVINGTVVAITGLNEGYEDRK
ncbi:MAG: type IV pilus modification PilV family protein, partial [Candidatus Geothermincolia bacterium]